MQMSESKLAKRETQEIQTTESTSPTTRTPPLRVPRVTVTRNEKTDVYTIVAEMPGIGKDDVEIKLKENELTIKGLNDHRFFKRTFTFRYPIRPEDVDASMVNGILTLTVKPYEGEVHTIKVK